MDQQLEIYKPDNQCQPWLLKAGQPETHANKYTSNTTNQQPHPGYQASTYDVSLPTALKRCNP